uniref:Secreted protein n=1 Tax=Panagrellus redivivus TaxID=6233 RepID=A0A7E4ZVU5_PANRE
MLQGWLITTINLTGFIATPSTLLSIQKLNAATLLFLVSFVHDNSLLFLDFESLICLVYMRPSLIVPLHS